MTTNTPQKSKQGGNAIALFSYIGVLFIIPLLTNKNDPFVKFHVKQGIILFIAEVITSVVAILPIVGWLIAPIAWVVWVVVSIIGITNVLSGKQKELPWIGKYADKINF